MHQQTNALARKSDASRSGAAPSAALWLGALVALWMTGWQPASPTTRDCAFPIEAAAHETWTTHAVCSTHDGDRPEIRGPARLLFGRTLDLNSADFKALQVLPRIGPSRAAAIVRTREQQEFSSLPDLARVPGIGPKTIAGLASWASVSSLGTTSTGSAQ